MKLICWLFQMFNFRLLMEFSTMFLCQLLSYVPLPTKICGRVQAHANILGEVGVWLVPIPSPREKIKNKKIKHKQLTVELLLFIYVQQCFYLQEFKTFICFFLFDVFV